MREPHVRRRRSRIQLPPWGRYALMGGFVVAVIVVGIVTFTVVRNFIANGIIDVGRADPSVTGPDAVDGGSGGDAEVVEGEEVPVDIYGRITVLVMGIDERESETGPWRTDTMIVLSLDPENNTASMLSMPRDLQVEIPNYGGVRDRINTAYFRGDADNYPGGGGSALALETVRYNFGVPVTHYLTVNFNAFVEVVDRMGCVPISVPITIDDPTYPEYDGYGYDPFHIEAGEHCLQGDTLLKYARTRATFGGDFDRAERQQATIRAIRSHVLSTNQLGTLITQAPDMYDILRDDVTTNLTLGQLVELARLAAQVQDDQICSAVINGAYVDLATLEDGSQVLIPDRTRVRELVDEMFSGGGGCTQQNTTPTGDLAELAAGESASVQIVNGTRTEGLATSTADLLAQNGINVVYFGNADRFDVTATRIVNYANKPYTARLIAQLMGLPESAVINDNNGSPGVYDIEVVIGTDYVP